MKTSLTKNPLFLPQLYINGCWLNTENTYPLYSPYDHTHIADLPIAGEQHILSAIEAAKHAFLLWKQTTPLERSQSLYHWYRAIQENTEYLAELIVYEQGMTITAARQEITYAASFIAWYAEAIAHHLNHTLPQLKKQQLRLVQRKPLGVCALITPFNLPASMITKKLAAALAAGCTAVIKPAETTPLTACALLQLLTHNNCLPPGVVNLLIGEPSSIGHHLTSHPDIAVVSFTGSTETGQIVAKNSASTLKKLSLELGGNAFALVLKDANIQHAVKEIAQNKKRGNGQICVAINRIYVLSEHAAAFTEALTAEVSSWHCGNPHEDNTDIGPLIHEAACQKTEALIADACSQGAHCLCGGKRHPNLPHTIVPTVLTHLSHSMRIAHTEIFAPVCPIYIYDHEDTMIEEACSIASGLSNYIFTQDIGRCIELSDRIETGMLSCNTGSYSHASVPFGGIHLSGQGREGSYLGLEDYTYVQYSCIEW